MTRNGKGGLDHRMIDDAFDKNKRKAQEKLGKAIGL